MYSTVLSLLALTLPVTAVSAPAKLVARDTFEIYMYPGSDCSASTFHPISGEAGTSSCYKGIFSSQAVLAVDNEDGCTAKIYTGSDCTGDGYEIIFGNPVNERSGCTINLPSYSSVFVTCSR